MVSQECSLGRAYSAYGRLSAMNDNCIWEYILIKSHVASVLTPTSNRASVICPREATLTVSLGGIDDDILVQRHDVCCTQFAVLIGPIRGIFRIEAQQEQLIERGNQPPDDVFEAVDV